MHPRPAGCSGCGSTEVRCRYRRFITEVRIPDDRLELVLGPGLVAHVARPEFARTRAEVLGISDSPTCFKLVRARNGPDEGRLIDFIPSADDYEKKRVHRPAAAVGKQGAASVAVRHVERGAKDAFDLFVRVQIRSCPLGLEGQQPGGRDLRAGIGGAAITGKTAHEAQAPRPRLRLAGTALLSPVEGQRMGDIGSPVLLHETDEGQQSLARLAQLEPKVPAQDQVVFNRLPKRVHSPRPGHGRASARNASTSTFV